MKKILIIEDDDYLRGLIVKKLKKENFKTIEANDGKEGIKKAKRENPDLILLDLILPGISGYEVLEALKKDKKTSPIPIIILSNLSQFSEIKKGLSMGASDYLIKTNFAPETIVEKIKENLQKKYARIT